MGCLQDSNLNMTLTLNRGSYGNLNSVLRDVSQPKICCSRDLGFRILGI